MKMKKELLKGLTPEQVARAKDCKNCDELLALAKQEGIELTDDQLEAVSGGCGTTTLEQKLLDEMTCPECSNWHCMEKVSDVWYRCKICQKITINKNLE